MKFTRLYQYKNLDMWGMFDERESMTGETKTLIGDIRIADRESKKVIYRAFGYYSYDLIAKFAQDIVMAAYYMYDTNCKTNNLDMNITLNNFFDGKHISIRDVAQAQEIADKAEEVKMVREINEEQMKLVHNEFVEVCKAKDLTVVKHVCRYLIIKTHTPHIYITISHDRSLDDFISMIDEMQDTEILLDMYVTDHHDMSSLINHIYNIRDSIC